MLELMLSLVLAVSLNIHQTETPAYAKKLTNPKLKRILLEAPSPFDPYTKPIDWFDKNGRVNWDAEKQQRHIVTDTIVIHHTALEPGLAPDVLSNLEIKRLYAPRFA